jgi:hypothetical protein
MYGISAHLRAMCEHRLRNIVCLILCLYRRRLILRGSSWRRGCVGLGICARRGLRSIGAICRLLHWNSSRDRGRRRRDELGRPLRLLMLLLLPLLLLSTVAVVCIQSRRRRLLLLRLRASPLCVIGGIRGRGLRLLLGPVLRRRRGRRRACGRRRRVRREGWRGYKRVPVHRRPQPRCTVRERDESEEAGADDKRGELTGAHFTTRRVC